MDPNTPYRSSSQHQAENTCSLSRKPSRRQQFTDDEIAPLLSNLSPSSTLEALAANNAVPAQKKVRQSFIQKSVASASTSERAWGIKAAFAGKKLREWYLELHGWSWPGYESLGSDREKGWVGPSTHTIQAREERIEIITDDMETLEVENLKDYIRSAHFGAQSRSTSASGSTMDYDHLDDFTAVITATIVQSLPTLSRLQSLLDIWTTRLMILRQVPTFFREVEDCQESMLSAWTAVGGSDASSARQRPGFSRKLSMEVQAVLQDQISRLGQRLDTLLDMLEGSIDTLPERWIDTMDRLEFEYSSWVVKAEELALYKEIGIGSNKDQENGPPPGNLQSAIMLDQNASDYSVHQQVDLEHGCVELSSEATVKLPRIERDEPLVDCPKQVEMTPNATFGPEILVLDDPSHELGLQERDSLQGTKNCQDSQKLNHRPPPLKIKSQNSLADSIALSDHASDISNPGSATSDYFSNHSSPELRSASIVEYVASPALVINPWSSKESQTPLEGTFFRPNLHSERADSRNIQLDGTSRIDFPATQRSRASTIKPDGVTHSELGQSDSKSSAISSLKHHARTRNTSIPSIPSIDLASNDDSRNVTVRRSDSCSSQPHYSSGSAPYLGNESDIPAVMVKEVQTPKPLEDISTSSQKVTEQDHAEASPSVHSETKPDTIEMATETPLSPSKAFHRFQHVSDLSPGSTPVEIRRKVHAPTYEKTLPVDPGKRLEARISSILTEIPTHIRLTSGPEPGAPEINGSNPRPKTPTSRSSGLRLNRSQIAVTPPTMTLAPAQPAFSNSKPQSGEPEIKLYHLHQSGKDVPIKLFVRLVGEAGERVMVRIGGGWADLAEYLKEYASHHGRRSVSDTRFDIQGLPSSPMTQGSSSRPSSPISTKASPAALFKRQQTTPGKVETPRTPASDPSHRPNSRMSWTDEDSPSLGLAGPKLKKVEISPRKQAWVDEMLEQAKGGGGGAVIGEIGKAGGTKRVFFKGRSRAPSNV